MAYTHFRYIAYEVPTVGTDANDQYVSEIPPGTKAISGEDKLKGNVKGLTTPDAKKRLLRYMGVMNLAKSRLQTIGDNDNTLKVFMAPEFYFRPTVVSSGTKDPAYSFQEYWAIKDVLRQTIAEDQGFRHWLIIPGTILWKWDQPGVVNRPIRKGEAVYFNSSLLIYSGGSGLNSKMIEKAKASPIDGLPTGRHGGGFNDDPKKKSTDEAWLMKYQTSAKNRKHFFACDTLSCALEICYEHLMYDDHGGLVKNTLSGWMETVGLAQRAKSVDLHLLTAGGAPIVAPAVAARAGGYVLRTDGLKFPGSPDQSNLCKITGYTSQDNGGGLASSFDTIPSYAVMDPNPTQADMSAPTTQNIGQDHELYLPRPQGITEGSWFSQRLKFYRPQTI